MLSCPACPVTPNFRLKARAAGTRPAAAPVAAHNATIRAGFALQRARGRRRRGRRRRGRRRARSCTLDVEPAEFAGAIPAYGLSAHRIKATRGIAKIVAIGADVPSGWFVLLAFVLGHECGSWGS